MTETSKSMSLDERLAAIGIMTSTRRISKNDRQRVDIEETLAAALIELASGGAPLRMLSLILSWVEEHGAAVIVEKLAKILARRKQQGEDVGYAALAGAFAESQGFRRWSKLGKFGPKTRRLVGPKDMAESLLRLKGEEEWSKQSGWILPKGVVRTEKKWVLSREQLARFHLQYRNRLLFGPQWRSDIVTAVQLGAKTPTEASRISGASYEPCHRVMSELAAGGFLGETGSFSIRERS